ncbi:F-type H+-transporting ATPase subunit delta [Spinactinospora alkalitolerans]|uniref:ATP synthase subunit delta n=1 Tax=Spinactinospora alkalitolerans TaxID=687207 RepID=A0A852U1P9_9ACTN|nr:F0F1 ATP synthase subunit delta [Spinactinospora alkalitolerans]NYE49455.1 F-type H+-transporting ATPase subunit delta [Spinactinospora alkalitolerans]
MRGVSRASLEEVTRRLDAVLESANAATLGHELFEVVSLLEQEHSLRRWLADQANPAESKSGLIGHLLESKVSPATIIVVSDIVQAKWSGTRDLVDAVEQAAVFATVAGVEGEQRLGELEDELFRFGRIVAAEPGLRSALTREGVAAEHKRTLVENLLSGKAGSATLALISQVVTRPRGRTLEQGIDHFGRLVAERAQRYVAVVRTAVPLSGAQQERLRNVLTQVYGRAIHLNIEVAPEIVGGLSIRVGDEVIDGTVAGRIAEVRRRLAG